MRSNSFHVEWQNGRRRGFALLATLLLITLLIAVGAQLATHSCVESAAAARRHRTLQHELAVESALLKIGESLAFQDAQAGDWIRGLDQFGFAKAEWAIGDLQVRCTMTDDAAKFNPVLFQRPDQAPLLERKLNLLAQRKQLSGATVELAPLPIPADPRQSGVRYRWFDQLLSDVQPGALFRWNDESSKEWRVPVWSDFITLWGDGRVDLRRVDPDLLEAVLEDLQPGLARLMLKARTSDRTVNFLSTALIDVPSEIRPAVQGRVTFDARRYALQLQTVLGGDSRMEYAILQVEARNAKVLHRSALAW